MRAAAVVGVLGRDEALLPGESAVRALARLEHVPPPNAVPLDPEREARREAERLPGPAGVGRVTVVSDERPCARNTSVVERGLADELDLDVPVQALDGPHEHVVGVVVGRRPRVRRDGVLAFPRPHRQRVAHDDPAARRLPRRLEDVRAGHVDGRGRMVDAERREAEEPGLSVEQASEDARRVEARGCRASRSLRRAPRARPCGSRRGTRTRRSAGTARAQPRSAAFALSSRSRVMTRSTARASAHGRRRGRRLPRVPRSQERTDGPEVDCRAAAA